MDLILVRHPQPDVASGVCYGQTDVPLIEPIQHGTLVARIRSAIGDRPLSAVHSSHLARARIPARWLSSMFHAPHYVDTRLAEMHFGEWEMRAWDEIDRSALDAWAQNVGGFAPPGGESARDVVLRVDAWAGELRSQASDKDEVHVVIGHAGPIRLHMATALRLPTATCLSWALDFGGICHLHIADDGNARLIHWNVQTNV